MKKSLQKQAKSKIVLTSLAALTLSFSSPLMARERAKNPADVARLFEQHFNHGNVEDLVNLYHSQAVFVPSPGQAVTQKPAIRSVLQQFLAAKVPIKLTVRQVFESGDTVTQSFRGHFSALTRPSVYGFRQRAGAPGHQTK